MSGTGPRHIQKLIVLDRDGVINHDSDEYIKTPQEWQPIAGSLEAIVRLNHAGYSIVVATNQSGIARLLLTMDNLMAIHNKMLRLTEAAGGRIEAVFFCPHAPADHCGCRKPAPGMYLDISRRFRIPPQQLFTIGDSLRDLQAAHAVRARAWLVRTGKGTQTETRLSEAGLSDTPVFDNLAAAAGHIIAQL